MNLTNPLNKRTEYTKHYLLVILLTYVAAMFVHYDVLWRWDNLLYDAQLSVWSRAVPDDIVIINIDNESLQQLGRWPWPRSTHARLINQLHLESPRVIGLDIIFSEPDSNDPLSDVLLARAMRSSGNVVLPVFMAQHSSNSYPIEALPLPEFTHNAAALGHVHIALSDDGIARKVYLKEGIGKPHWMHYSLAVLSVSDIDIDIDRLINAENHKQKYSPMQWSRQHPFLIPYAGPPGHFNHIGYSQVLSGNYPKNFFRDKIVLIGATAEGLGDTLPTPLSSNSNNMAGVEIIANVIDAIRQDIHINEINKTWLIFITVFLVALPMLIYPYISPANTIIVLFSVITGTIIMVVLLLFIAGIWVPISTVLLLQIISYPLWSWRRLNQAMHHINNELNNLTARQKKLSVRKGRNIVEEIKFITQFIPIKGWVIQNKSGDVIIKQGTIPVLNLKCINPEAWTIDGYRYWANINYKNTPCLLGLSIGADAIISDEEMRLLNSLIETPLCIEINKNAYLEDALQAKIQQVQAAGIEYEELRGIIDDSLSGMADGILICSSRGQIMLSNRRAGWYLFSDDNASINGKSLLNILQLVQQKNGDSWKSLLQTVLFKQKRVISEARHKSGRELMVEISPLKIISDVFDGFVVNFSDISMLKASEKKRTDVLNFLSHDLRSPLASMISMIELAKNKTSLSEIHNMLDGMETQTHKTLHLAEQFLQLSRANTSENLKFYDVDFNSIALNAIDRLWALSKKSGISIEHTFYDEELWTHGEPDLLERAIINLLSNAIKHSKTDATVSLSVQIKNKLIHCCIIDHGSGIAEAELPHLFETFKRTRSAGVEHISGTGLGLAFVDAVARRHSGHIDVESKVDEGSSFCLKIPMLEHLEPDTER